MSGSLTRKVAPFPSPSLAAWIGRHYRDRLSAADLGDPALLEEGRRALDELTQIMRLGSVYPFQRG